MKIKLMYVLMVVAVLGIAGAASASDLAIYSGPTNAGWISNDTCQANTNTIMNDARMKKLFDAIDNFGDNWLAAHGNIMAAVEPQGKLSTAWAKIKNN